MHPVRSGGGSAVLRSSLAWFGVLAGIGLAAAPAQAERFRCPRTGGAFVFAQSANVVGLDQMASSAVSTRNIAMNIFETLVTRDDANKPIPELADSINESPDHLTYTFPLRRGVRFHNGKVMTSADIAASFDRYKRVGLQRNTFENVAGWETPDADPFVIRLKQVQPAFLDQLSSSAVPIVIVPAGLKDDAPQQLRTIGTGPW